MTKKYIRILALMVAFLGVMIAGWNYNIFGLIGASLIGLAAPFYFGNLE